MAQGRPAWSSPTLGPTDWGAVDKPHYHVAPESGWINDPNGPLYFNGTYHIFYQHLPGSAQWGFNLVWGHATSKDLVHWQLLDHAIEPTNGSVDNDGCFSGCAAIDTDGTPCLLYSAVRLRGSAAAGPLPPPECDLSLPFIETQCIVYAENPHGDWRLPFWRKSNVPLLSLPPAGLKLAGWRDPYVIGPPVRHPERGWTMLIGSGIKEQGGTTLVYRSKELSNGWKLAGELCSGKQEDGTGIVWECPLMARLDPLDSNRLPPGHGIHVPRQQQGPHGHHNHHNHQPAHQGDGKQLKARCLENNGSAPHQMSTPAKPASLARSHFFCISPDACTNPTLYYLGDYLEAEQAQGEHIARASTTMDPLPTSNGAYGNPVPDMYGAGCPKFLVREALGPFKLDLGDILYAPNTLMDLGKGRLLLFAWLQEARKVTGTYTYAGCLCLPRELWLDYSEAPDRPYLVQRPLDEVMCLRKPGHTWTYISPQPLPASWVQEEAPALSDYKRPADPAAAATAAATAAQDDVQQEEQQPQPEPLRPSSHPLSYQGIKEMEPLGQIQPSHMQHDLRSHPLNPFSRQSLNPDGPASGLSIAEQETANQLDASIHGGPEAHDSMGFASPGDPLLLGPGQSFPVPLVEGPFLELEVVLELFDDAGQPRRICRRRGAAGAQEVSRQQPGEGGGQRQSDVFLQPPEAELLQREGVRRASGEHEEALAPPPVGACSGVVLRSWQAGVEGAAAVLYCWDTGVLEVVFEALDPETHEYSLAAPGCRRVGGKLQRPPAPGQPIALRLFIDYSLLEVYTGSGEVLSTRVYRGVGPPGGGAGVEVVSVGCNTHVAFMAAHEMTSCYVLDQQDLEEQLQHAATSRSHSATDLELRKDPPVGVAALPLHAPNGHALQVHPQEGANKASEAEEIAEIRRQLRAAALGQYEGPSYEDKLLASLGISLEEEGTVAWKRSAGSKAALSKGPSRRSSIDSGLFNGPRRPSSTNINMASTVGDSQASFDMERLGNGGQRGQDQLQGLLDRAASEAAGGQLGGSSRRTSLDSAGSLGVASRP